MLEINTKFMMTVFVEQPLDMLRSDNKYVLEFSLNSHIYVYPFLFAVSNIYNARRLY